MADDALQRVGDSVLECIIPVPARRPERSSPSEAQISGRELRSPRGVQVEVRGGHLRGGRGLSSERVQ
jgi:hypothetical protein